MSRYLDPAEVLGPDVAQRVEPLGNGRRYVRATQWALFFSWLVDFGVFVIGLFVGAMVLASVPSLDNVAVGTGVLVLVPAVPLLYGVLYGNGRSLGAVLTGTRLVQLKDGGRLGARGPWAMLVRLLLLPLLMVFVLIGAFAGGTGSPPGSLRRGSIDVEASNRLWAAEAAN
ncbi:hypothetical protein [Kribbella sp. NPDC051770]|uniref:hypothetical protein n=1 Tax=Kribbella sp. NPDC051770 TaxID=3155413 RepID=UPI003429857C